MTVAVQTLATSEYGALNDEVKKMSDQLSWGIKFSDVILQFAERVGTPLGSTSNCADCRSGQRWW